MDFLFLPFITMMALNSAPEATVTANNASVSPVNAVSFKKDPNDQEDRISVYRNGEVVDFTKYAGNDAKTLNEIEYVTKIAAAYAGGEDVKNIKREKGLYGDGFAALTFANNEKFLDGDMVSFNLSNCVNPKQFVEDTSTFPTFGDFKIPAKANGASKALVSSIYKVENIKKNGELCWYASVKRDLVTIGKLKEPVKFDPEKEAAELVLVPVK